MYHKECQGTDLFSRMETFANLLGEHRLNEHVRIAASIHIIPWLLTFRRHYSILNVIC